MATPPFNPNVPLATSSPSQDQPVLLANSQTWYQTWNADGVTAGSSSNVGFSNQRTFVRRTAPPAPNATNGQLFSQEDASGVAQLYWIASTQDGGGISQITSNTPSGSTAGSNGYYASTLNALGVVCTVQQWFWILPGNIQYKQIRIDIPVVSIPNAQNPQLAGITFAGTGGVAAPFASQPISATYYFAANIDLSVGTTSDVGVMCNSSTLPSSATYSAAYIDGIWVRLVGSNTYARTCYITVMGI
jgi:hypothetical protein